MAARVRKELEAGCFGLSTGLEYEPGRFSNLKELIAIAEPVGELGRLVSSHMRSEDDDKIHEAIAELINQGRGANCRVHISHFKITYGKGKDRANEVLKQVHKARKSGVDITADQYPYPASFTTIGIVFPNWARPPVDFDEVVAERRDELEEYLRNRIAQRNGPEATLFGTAPWAGKTLKDVAEELDKPFEKVLIDDIGPRGASAAYFIMDDDVIETFMADPHTMICSDGSPTMRHPRGYGSFAKIIRYYVNERNVMPLETAIHKMTLLSAKTFGLDKLKRGKIAEGWKADLVIFDPDKVQDNANFENPHQLAEGFDYVFVNGKAARANGEFTEGMYGQVLRHP
jgi:N-acyl-D-aspartate/D-glutamate deacylase